MNSKNLWRNLAVIITLMSLALAAFATIELWPKLNAASQQGSLAKGYETEALASPFTLESKTWSPSAGAWTYSYTAGISPPDAVAAAKSQLAAGKGYQVVATRPDVVAADSSTATLYRDLITEDVALKVQIAPNPSQVASAPPSLVTVTLSPMQGN